MSGDLTGVYKIAMGYDKVDIKLIAVVRQKCLGTTTCSGWWISGGGDLLGIFKQGSNTSLRDQRIEGYKLAQKRNGDLKHVSHENI